MDKLASANQTIERLRSDKPVDHRIGDLQVRGEGGGRSGREERGDGRRGELGEEGEVGEREEGEKRWEEEERRWEEGGVGEEGERREEEASLKGGQETLLDSTTKTDDNTIKYFLFSCSLNCPVCSRKEMNWPRPTATCGGRWLT